MKRTKLIVGSVAVAAVMATAAFLAKGQGTTQRSSIAEQEVVNRMVAAAEAGNKRLIDIEDIRVKTPEFVEARLLWHKRLLQAHLLQNPEAVARRKLINGYIEDLQEMELNAAHATDEGPANRLPPIRFALAEAEYFKLTGMWPFEGSR